VPYLRNVCGDLNVYGSYDIPVLFVIFRSILIAELVYLGRISVDIIEPSGCD